jgi:hypothetical protein
LSPEELKQVFSRFQSLLIEKGMPVVSQRQDKNQEFAKFALGGGKSGFLREPFEEYLELSYSPEDGFVLRIVRIIDHPVDFSKGFIEDFELKTEQLIREAASRDVRLRVIK